MENNRYVINYGAFGPYFYDREEDKQLSLRRVLEILNED